MVSYGVMIARLILNQLVKVQILVRQQLSEAGLNEDYIIINNEYNDKSKSTWVLP